MPIKYTRAEIIRKIEDAVKDGMSEFYQKKFINYTGTTSDTKEYYTEIIAEWCCNHKELFSDIKKIKREEKKLTLRIRLKTLYSSAKRL